MRTKTVLFTIFGIAVISVLCLLTISHESRRVQAANGAIKTFSVHGQVRGLDGTDKTIRMAHDEIPDYMPAMVMNFSVKDRNLLKGLAVGQDVQFELSVTDDDSWISRIEAISSSPVGTGSGATDPIEQREANRIHAGEVVPDFQLLDQDGNPLHLRDLRGTTVILTFIYTRCPLPNFCPLMSKNFAELEQRLSREMPGKYRLLSISMDPEFDRPTVLKEYASRYNADTRNWTFATGTPEQIDFVADLMGLYYAKENGLISHDLRTAMIAPDGRLVHLWKSNFWTPYEVERLAKESAAPTQTASTP